MSLQQTGGAPPLFLYSFPFEAMGTACVLHLYTDTATAADAAAIEIIDEVFRIENRYSRYRADSFLSHINSIAQIDGGLVDLDDETAALVDYAYACHRKSDGLFDITSGILRNAWNFNIPQLPQDKAITALLPHIGMDKLTWLRPTLKFVAPGMELDFGGIGKEYAADRAASLCADLGITHGLIDLGGDIRAVGPHPDGAPWHVRIRHPRLQKKSVIEVDLCNGALATSGDYERYIEVDGQRYCHILNPKTGWPVQGLSSVSIHAQHCLLAGSLATIAMLKGADGKDWLSELGVKHHWVDHAGQQGGSLISSSQ